MTRTHFAFRIDMCDANRENLVEHIAGVEDYQVAQATYRAAVERWPGTAITLRQGARVIEDRRTRLPRGPTRPPGRAVKPRAEEVNCRRRGFVVCLWTLAVMAR